MCFHQLLLCQYKWLYIFFLPGKVTDVFFWHTVRYKKVYWATLVFLPWNDFQITFFTVQCNCNGQNDTLHLASLVEDYITCLPGTLSQEPTCPVLPASAALVSFPSRLCPQHLWSLLCFCHSEHMETRELASYSQAKGVDVGVWNVAVKWHMFSLQGAGQATRVLIVLYQASQARCVTGGV